MKKVKDILDEAVSTLNQLQQFHYARFGSACCSYDEEYEQGKQHSKIEAVSKELDVYYFHDNINTSTVIGTKAELEAIVEKTAIEADDIREIDDFWHYDIVALGAL